MDLYEWAAGTWYAEMSAVGRALYTDLKVGAPEAERIANIVYGMEIRAKALLETDDRNTVPGRPPQDQIADVLLGKKEHVEGPALRPQHQTPDYAVPSAGGATATPGAPTDLHSRRAQAEPSQTK